jgi:hypothetical protein
MSRAYFIGNMYLSSIQQGIQATHCLAELYNKYTPVDNSKATMEFAALNDWATEHKTVILLNGGFSLALRELHEFLDNEFNPYPFARFHEGEDALDSALTCVGIVLPEKIYEGARQIRSSMGRIADERWIRERVLHIEVEGNMAEYAFTKWERDLMVRMNSYRLAQ